jgi:ATP-dependent Clp protease ATP-binding subunit ClpC
MLDDGYLTYLGRKVDFKKRPRNRLLMLDRQLKDFGQGVGFGTAAKVAQADDNSKV